MQRELPIINIEGTDFRVDVNRFALIEKSNPDNFISVFNMRDTKNGYEFEYGLSSKNIKIPLFDREIIPVKIPDMCVLDPIGMAIKHNVPFNEIKGKTDFELMVDQETFDKRVNKGMLPTLDILGYTFFVDIPMGKLRPKDDFLSKGIVFSEIDNYYDMSKRNYTIPYNPQTHAFEKLDFVNIKEIPRDVVAVTFPSERILDRIGWNRKYRFNIIHGLKIAGLKTHFEAKKVSWRQTPLLTIIRDNLKKQKIEEEKQKLSSRAQAPLNKNKRNKI